MKIIKKDFLKASQDAENYRFEENIASYLETKFKNKKVAVILIISVLLLLINLLILL